MDPIYIGLFYDACPRIRTDCKIPMDFIYAFNLDQHPDNPSIVELSLSFVLVEMRIIYACVSIFNG